MIKFTPYLLIFATFLLLPGAAAAASSSSSASSNTTTTPSSGNIEWWCKQIPHPKACLRHLSPHHNSHLVRGRSHFFRLSVLVASDLTLRAQSRLDRVSSQCRHNNQHHLLKLAVDDCRRLYGIAFLHLNRTLRGAGSGQGRAVDAQTWLSAALTNLDTCSKGFSDLGAPADAYLPVLSRYDVPSLVSNCLAINTPRVTYGSVIADVPRKLLRTDQTRAEYNIVVAKDGSGNYKTVTAAVDSATARRMNGEEERIVIYVKAGVYEEIVQVGSFLTDLTVVGDGMGKTIITGSRSVSAGYTTFSSPTFSVFGDGFIAKSITFRNTFGPGSQAVALLSGSDRSVFYRCSVEGYQDTLCVYTQRQFYRECDIYGTVDFIFGNAAAVIQNSTIYARRPNRGEANVVTAQGRTDRNQNTGIVVQFSRITAAPELLQPPAVPGRAVRSFLGRPWMRYSRAVFLQNYIDGVVDPAGWLPYAGSFALDTLFYAEYKNTGPGSRTKLRVTWPGYHVIKRPSLVKQFTVPVFITGKAWIPATSVPFL